jgi:nucleoside-diphosphate-sugar epimerase
MRERIHKENWMARFLVTGGAGFIGSNIVGELVRRGESVRIIDNFSTGRRGNIEEFGDSIEVVEADICDRTAVEKAMKGSDYVLHQAALASVQRSIDDPEATNEVNIRGTLNLLQAARRESVKRFVYASSSSVYGDSEELPKHENMPANPKSPYALTKLAGEWYARIFSDIYGLETVGLRYFNIFGPKQDPDSEYSAVIPIFVKSLLGGVPPAIYGDGEQSRDFTYIDNVVQANMLACAPNVPPGKVYNVACGDRFTLNFLFDMLKTILKRDVSAVNGPPRLGDVRHSMASIGRIEKDLGYRVLVDFEEGLRKTVAWYRTDGNPGD